MARHTGILSDSDKEFLFGQMEFEGENAEAKENQKRYRIRQKVLNALNDFGILELKLPEKDRRLIFDDKHLSGETSAIRFIYQGMRENEKFKHGKYVEDAIGDIEERYAPHGTVVEDVNISISFTEQSPDIDLLRERFEQGEPLTDREVGSLVRVGAIGPDELEEVQWNYEKWDLDEIEYKRSDTHPREG